MDFPEYQLNQLEQVLTVAPTASEVVVNAAMLRPLLDYAVSAHEGITLANSEVGRLDTWAKKLRNDLREARAEVERLNTWANKLRNDLRGVRLERDSLLPANKANMLWQRDEARAEVEQLRVQINGHSAEIERLRSELRASSARIAEQRDEVNRAEQKPARRKAQIAKALGYADDSDANWDTIVAYVTALRDEEIKRRNAKRFADLVEKAARIDPKPLTAYGIGQSIQGSWPTYVSPAWRSLFGAASPVERHLPETFRVAASPGTAKAGDYVYTRANEVVTEYAEIVSSSDGGESDHKMLWPQADSAAAQSFRDKSIQYHNQEEGTPPVHSRQIIVVRAWAPVEP